MLYRYKPGVKGTAMAYKDDGTYITTLPLTEVSPGLYHATEIEADYYYLQFNDGFTDYIVPDKVTVKTIQERPILSEKEL